MPFPERLAHWITRSQGGRCAALHYSEEQGFVQCENPVENVHHLTPEAWVLAGNEDFANPNEAPGVGLCLEDHKKKHPNLAVAQQEYRQGQKDAYKRMARENQQLASQGIVYWNSDGDESLIERSQETQWMYSVLHPEDPKPEAPHHKHEGKRLRKWWENFFDGKDDR